MSFPFKKTLWGIVCTFNMFQLAAQESTGYYFEEFTPGKVILKNHQFAKGKFNYDCVNRQMHFLNGNTDMIVENLADIDTVSIDTHRFIPYENHFLEVFRSEKSTLFVDWKLEVKETGKKGAMGITTQGSVQAIDVNTRFQRVNGDQNLDLSVYKMDTKHTFYVLVKNKMKSFRNEKTFLGLFSKNKQQEIKGFIDAEKINMENPNDLLKVLDVYSSAF